jgi:hypothetical protein
MINGTSRLYLMTRFPRSWGGPISICPGYHRWGAAWEVSALTRSVHVPYAVEQDEDGVWCAHAQLRPGVGAHGEGTTAHAAVEDLRVALAGLIAEFGAPDELTVTVEVA